MGLDISDSVLVGGQFVAHWLISQSKPKNHTGQVSRRISRLVGIIYPLGRGLHPRVLIRVRGTLSEPNQNYLGTIADQLLLGSLVQAMANPFIQVHRLCDHLSDLVHSTVLRLSQGTTDGFIGQMVSFPRAAAPTSTTGQTFPNIPLLSCFLSRDFTWQMAGQRSCSPLVNPTPSGDISTGWL